MPGTQRPLQAGIEFVGIEFVGVEFVSIQGGRFGCRQRTKGVMLWVIPNAVGGVRR